MNNYHYCRSQPKVRHNPKLFGLSQKALEIIGLDYEEVKNDPNTPSFLSGSKLIDGSSVLLFLYSQQHITIVDINLEIGQDSLEMVELTLSATLNQEINTINFNSKEVAFLPFHVMQMVIVF